LAAPVGLLSTIFAFQGSQSAKDNPDREDYFKKWLNEDVVYIISSEEKAVFQKLTTPEEKEQFIEQFWQRRNPDPRSSVNEFKEEHYRRIAYANEHFTSGEPGWMTDRGRIYIIHGKPDEVVSRPDGGTYVRPIEEGGGTTTVYPYEKWRYRYIEGLGTNIELEFVDKSNTGKYELAVTPWEKDALLEIGLGPTLAEETGLTTRADHPALNPAAGGAQYGPANLFARRTDTPFARYELAAKVQAPPILRYKALKEMVEVNVKYNMLPFEVRQDCLKLNDDQVLVPITVELRNSDLTFKTELGSMVARVGVYGVVTNLANRIIREFEDDVVVSVRNEDFQKAQRKFAGYQKIVSLSRTGRYKLALVLKDLNSGNVGTFEQAIVPPSYNANSLSSSSLILSNYIQPLKTVPTGDEMFILGDVKILPKLDRRFTLRMPLGVYLQIYNAALDQSTSAPALTVRYKLYQGDRLLAVATDENGESMQFFSSQRVVLVKQLRLDGLKSGKYQIQVEVTDRLSNQRLQTSGNFSIVDENPSS
jgi:GWxTD domain-containing protein